MKTREPQVRPFPFETCPKITRPAAAALNALYEFLPQFGSLEQFRSDLQSYLTAQIGLDFKIQLADVVLLPFQTVLSQDLSEHSSYALLSLAPARGRAVIEIESRLASLCIDQLMGGGEGKMARPLGKKMTEIDQGVLSFFLIKTLAYIYEWTGEAARLHFRLEDVVTGVGTLESLFQEGEVAPVFLFRVSLGEHSGVLRLILPSALIQTMALTAQRNLSERENLFFRERAAQFDFLETEIWAQVGQTRLKVSEINQLEKGDIVLFDETQARIGPDKVLEGEVELRVGKGTHVAFPSSIIAGRVGSRKTTVRLERILRVS